MKSLLIIILVLLSCRVFALVDFVNNSGFTWPHTYQPGSACEKKGYVTVGFSVNFESNNDKFLLERTTDPNWNSWVQVHVFDGCGTCGAGSFQYDDYGVNGGFPNNQFPSDGTVYYYRVRSKSNSLNYQTFDIASYTALIVSTENWEDQITNHVTIGTTSNNESAHNWQGYTNLIQGVTISLVPTEISDIYIEQNNSKINFESEESYPFVSLSVNINNSGYSSIYSGSAKTNFVWNGLGALNNLGINNLKLKYTGISGAIIFREYRVNTVQASLELYKSNNCDVMRMYGDPSRPNSLPIIISEGFDSYNTTPIQFYRFAGNDLINCLIAKGFKVYIINYKYNSQDLRNNAAIYSSAVRYVSSINNNVPIVAGGISMGGVIARYALAKAEGNNNPLPVSKFVSIDAPQQGAVVSQQLQDFKKSQQQNAGNAAFLLQGLNNDAAKELLLYNTFDQSAGVHNSFYSELNGLNGNGYPHLTENIAVSFSSPLPHNILGQTWLRIDAQNTFYQFNVQTIQISSGEDQAGSFLPTSSTNIDPVTTQLSWWLNGTSLFPLNTIDVAFTKFLNPTFIPHVSALDIVSGVSKFDKTIFTSNTTPHDVVPSDIIEPLINAIIKNNVYVQNKIYTTSHITIASKSIFAGTNVTTGVGNGNVVVNSGVNVLYKAGETVQLSDGFIALAGSEFIAKIEQVHCDGVSENQNRLMNVSSKTTSQFIDEMENGKMADIHKPFHFSIYPNPNEGNLSLSLFASELMNISVSLEDLTGKSLLNQNFLVEEGNNVKQLNLQNYANGIYVLKITSDAGRLLKTEKIVLSR